MINTIPTRNESPIFTRVRRLGLWLLLFQGLTSFASNGQVSFQIIATSVASETTENVMTDTSLLEPSDEQVEDQSEDRAFEADNGNLDQNTLSSSFRLRQSEKKADERELTLAKKGLFKKTLKNPLASQSVVLVYFDKLMSNKNDRRLVLSCATPAGESLQTCQEFLVTNVDVKNRTVRELGKLPKDHLADLFAHLINGYKSHFNSLLLGQGTVFGILIGTFLGKPSVSIVTGSLGFIIDVIKLPITLPFATGNYIARRTQKDNLLERLHNLLFNKQFRSTRIVSIKNYDSIVNEVYDYLGGFSQIH